MSAICINDVHPLISELNLTCCVFLLEFIIADFLRLDDEAIWALADAVPPLMHF